MAFYTTYPFSSILNRIHRFPPQIESLSGSKSRKEPEQWAIWKVRAQKGLLNALFLQNNWIYKL